MADTDEKINECIEKSLNYLSAIGRPGWNPCKPYAEDAPGSRQRHAKVTNNAKLYLPPS